jgi:hypothetical protein
MLGRVRIRLLALDGGCLAVSIELDRHFRVLELHGSDVHEVTPQHKLLAFALHDVSAVARRMTAARQCLYARHEIGIAIKGLELACLDVGIEPEHRADRSPQRPADARLLTIAIGETKEAGGRITAIGTTIARALEHSAMRDGCVHAGKGLATQRTGAGTDLRVVDALLSGRHEPDTSHYQLLRAFTDDASLRQADAELEAAGYRTHEFGDSVLIERRK